MRRLWLWVFPKYMWTAALGWFAGTAVSRRFIFAYARHYRIPIHEADRPLREYRNLQEFFSRGLRLDTRPIAKAGLASPVDGTVCALGRIVDGQLLQVKGSTYTLAALLADTNWARRFEGGDYVTLYLSPRDYHRIHMPVDARVVAWSHVPGTLFPVNSRGITSIPGLFTRNERLVTVFSTAYGELAIVHVGAAGVGRIRTPYSLTDAGRRRRRQRITGGQADMAFSRGQEIGRFELGSTVIVTLAKGIVTEFLVNCGQQVKMGEALALLRDP